MAHNHGRQLEILVSDSHPGICPDSSMKVGRRTSPPMHTPILRTFENWQKKNETMPGVDKKPLLDSVFLAGGRMEH